MELTLLRHAESEYNQFGVFQGRIDCGLSKKGIAQTMEKAKCFDSTFYDICFSSPLIRTIQTAKILVPDMPLQFDARLIERNLGDWQNTPITDEKLFFLNNLHQTPPNGESSTDITTRVKEFIRYLSDNYADKRILIITHAGIVYALQMALGLELRQLDNLETITISLGSKKLIKKH